MTSRRQGESVPPPPRTVEERVRNARDSLPGKRDALAPGTLRALPPDPQGDEHREPVSLPTPPP